MKQQFERLSKKQSKEDAYEPPYERFKAAAAVVEAVDTQDVSVLNGLGFTVWSEPPEKAYLSIRHGESKMFLTSFFCLLESLFSFFILLFKPAPLDFLFVGINKKPAGVTSCKERQIAAALGKLVWQIKSFLDNASDNIVCLVGFGENGIEGHKMLERIIDQCPELEDDAKAGRIFSHGFGVGPLPLEETLRDPHRLHIFDFLAPEDFEAWQKSNEVAFYFSFPFYLCSSVVY